MNFVRCVATLTMLFSSLAGAQNIATCGSVKGYSNYHYAALVSKADSGMTTDQITGGMTTLQRTARGEFDIQIADARKRIISLVQDGGKVLLLRAGHSEATFLHIFPGKVIELYTFWEDSDGGFHVDLIQSKGGDAMPIHKSALMTGHCDVIDFSLITER